MKKHTHPSASRNQHLIGVLVYLFGVISGIIFLLFEKKNKFIRFHAMQSTITFGGIFLLHLIFNYLQGFGFLVNSLLSLISLILWIFLMIKAYKGEYYKLPYIGDLAEAQLKKMG